jgi:hypothetical protein
MSKIEETVDKLKTLREDTHHYESFLRQMSYSSTYIRQNKTVLFWHWLYEEELPYTLHKALREFICQKLDDTNKEIESIERYLDKAAKPDTTQKDKEK